MSKIILMDGEPAHWCPGCRQLHLINVRAPNKHTGAVWTWNGDRERPTFSPSVNVVGRCHYFVTDGQINYLDDSAAHRLRGVHPLPDVPEDERAWAEDKPAPAGPREA